jgi:hypothetical protein
VALRGKLLRGFKMRRAGERRHAGAKAGPMREPIWVLYGRRFDIRCFIVEVEDGCGLVLEQGGELTVTIVHEHREPIELCAEDLRRSLIKAGWREAG